MQPFTECVPDPCRKLRGTIWETPETVNKFDGIEIRQVVFTWTERCVADLEIGRRPHAQDYWLFFSISLTLSLIRSRPPV